MISALIRASLGSLGLGRDDDLFQDAWLEVWVRWTRIVDGYSTKRGTWEAWIRRCCRNAVIDCARSRSMDSSLSNHMEFIDLIADQADALDDDAHETRELLAILQDAMGILGERVSPRNYEALRMSLLEGFPIHTIATRLESTPEKTRKRIERMMRKLRALCSKLQKKKKSSEGGGGDPGE